MLRNIAVVMRGTVLAQVIGVIVLPVLSRHFSPEAFGQFQIYQSILGLLLIVPTLRYEIAILRAQTPNELGALMIICTASNFGLAAIFSVTNLFAERVFGYSFYKEYGFSFLLLVAGFLFGGIVQYIGYFLIREELFKSSSNAKIIQSGANGGFAIVLAFLRPLLNGIVLADIVGRFAGSIASVAFGVRQLRLSMAMPSRDDIVCALKKYRKYPLISVPGGLVNVAGATLTSIMIYRVFDAATSGQFGLLQRGAAVPVGLISASISQVYMSQLAADIRAGRQEAFRHFCRLVGYLSLVCAPPAIIIELFARPLFAYIFGAGWSQAALFAQLMMPSLCVATISGAIGMSLVVMGWQRTQFIWELTRLAAMAGLWIGGAKLDWSVNIMVAGHSAILTVFGLVMILLSGFAVRTTITQAAVREVVA